MTTYILAKINTHKDENGIDQVNFQHSLLSNDVREAALIPAFLNRIYNTEKFFVPFVYDIDSSDMHIEKSLHDIEWLAEDFNKMATEKE